MSLNPSLRHRHAPVLALHTDKCSSNHCSIQEIKALAPLLPWQFAVPLLVGCCGIKRSRLIYPRDMAAQTDGRERKPSRAINHSRAALPAVPAARSQRDQCSRPELCPCPVPWGGQESSTPRGLHPSSDTGTTLQAQQASHFALCSPTSKET